MQTSLPQLCFKREGNENILEAQQWIPRPVDEVFSFFSVETNLEKLTPAFMKFKVMGKSTPEIGEGTLIDYRLGLHGVPMRWRTRIESWKPGVEFVDNQLVGPYRLWHHTHRFESRDGGTLMTDRVRFALPMAPLGDWFAGPWVRKNVETIFRFRHQAIEALFAKSRP